MNLNYEEISLLQARLRKMADDLEEIKILMRKNKKEEFHQHNDLNGLLQDLAKSGTNDNS